MIASPQNEKLKLVRKLRERKHREREGLFVTEGEDLLEAGLAAGAEPQLRAERRRAAASAGEEVEPELLASVSDARLGDAGDRGLGAALGDAPPSAPCVYLHGVGDPGNVGAIVRTAHALLDGTVVLGPGCADPFSPKAVRASMGSIFARSRWSGPGRRRRRSRGSPWSPTAARASSALGGGGDALPRRRARGPAGGGARRAARPR